ncbi:HAMP domain-containing sensor histidine kinase [Pseudomonas syringae]|uniref:HAMP domain-containing sensor histidine kinase n=2 Tax=Pseudomonas syringae TaxID=317 RepID=UPI000D3F5A04|nr:ATP-binding protein [Pseudomonas syringae]POD16382.1 two-component sensor histidine kinase [Pseudomonas syringae pv. syringae]POD57051.1 two-component sensor histidine kinase [Pseudomonas syringae pv. syringae]
MFWKLFLAFWLATSLTFMVGAGLFMFTQSGRGDPSFSTVLDNEVRILQQSGIAAGQALLNAWQPEGHGRVGLYDLNGLLLAGEALENPRFELAVHTREGALVHIRSTQRPNHDDHPSHLNPLITGTVMSALFSWFLSSYLVAPLMKLREAMGKVARGRFDTRVKPDMGRRRDEIVDLAEDCDRMANQLKVMADSQQQLLHDISHELRSPLTRMSAAIGLLRQEPTQLDMLERIERESERMDSLIEELLTLARMQSDVESLTREKVDVISLLAAIVEDAEFEAGLKQCRVRLQAPGSFVAQVDSELLYRAFENVIRNAVRHTAVGTDVVVVANVQAQPLCLMVNVIDQGPGVDEECLQRIFQPFERGPENVAQGFGLGLAIALRAIEMHGGQIAARNRPGGGLVVDVLLPVS